jgi:hypothetical protein
LLGAELQTAYTLDLLPGKPLALARYGIPQNDLSSLVQRFETWSVGDVEALSKLFGGLPCAAPLLVFRVRGTFETDDVRSRASAIAALTCESGQVEVQALRPPGVAR